MILIICKSFRDPGKHILIGFTRQQIAIFKRYFTKLCQERVPLTVNLHTPDHAQIRSGLMADGRILGLGSES